MSDNALDIQAGYSEEEQYVEEQQQYEEPEQQQEEPSNEITEEHIAAMSDEDIESMSLDDIRKAVVETAEAAEEEGTDTGTATAEEIKDMSAEEFRNFLTSPFRANKTTVQVTDPEDLRQLVQMGMNYQKKLGVLRPHLAAIKALKEANLLETSQVNQLIELSQGKPEAVAQFLRDKNIDTYSLPDVDDETPYSPENHVPTQEEYDFTEAVEDLRGDASGQLVIDTLYKWDEESKGILFSRADLLPVLRDQVESGLFQDTLNILQKEEALGRLQNVPMIEAYNTVATQLMNEPNARYNNNVYNGTTERVQSTPQRQIVGDNRQRSVYPPASNSRKAGAGIPNGGSAARPTNFTQPLDIANISEEELDKYGTFEEFVVKNNIRFK